MRQSFVPRDFDQLLRALNALRKSHHVYARLVRAEDGAVVAGEFLPSLPVVASSPCSRPRTRAAGSCPSAPSPCGTSTSPPNTSFPDRVPSPSSSSRERASPRHPTGESMKRRVVLALCLVGLSSPLFRRPTPVLQAGRLLGLPRRGAPGAFGGLRRARAPGPGHQGAARRGGALRVVPGHGLQGRPSTPAPATRARSIGSPTARPASSSTRPSSRSTPSPWARTDKLYVGTSPDGKVYAVDATGKLARPSSILRTSTSGPWPSTSPATSWWPPGREGRVYRVDAKGASEHPAADCGDPRPLPCRGPQRGGLRGQRSLRHPLSRGRGGQGVRGERLDVSRGQVARCRQRRQRVCGRWSTASRAARKRCARPGGPPTADGGSHRERRGDGDRGPDRHAPRPAAPAGSGATTGGPPKGALVRIAPGGEIDTLWSSSEDTPQSVQASADGACSRHRRQGAALPRA